MKCGSFKFSGKGQRETPVADVETILDILKYLPVDSSHSYRAEVPEMLKELLEKDPRFRPLFKGAAASSQVDRQGGSLFNCQNTEVPQSAELQMLQMEERKISIQERLINLRKMQIQSSREEFHLFKDQLGFFKEELKVDGVTPSSISNAFQDYTFNKFLQCQKGFTTNGIEMNAPRIENTIDHDGIASDQNLTSTNIQSNMFETIGLQDYVLELQKTKFTPDMLKYAGKMLSDRYKEKYGKNPDKEQRRCDGKMFFVNVYQRKDSDLMKATIENTEQEFQNRQMMHQTSITRYTTQQNVFAPVYTQK